MADSTLRLSIDARGARAGAREFSRSADDINRKANRAAQGAERVEGSFSRLRGSAQALAGAFAALGGALAVREFTRLADTATQIENRLRVVTRTTQELVRVQNELFRISQSTRTEFTATTQLYSRLALAATELGASQQQLLQFTRGVGQALAITGTGAREASGALLQLSQAIGGGIVRAEEFNSLLEGTPRIAQAVARGLDRAGGSVARLRNLVIEGEVTSRQFFDAFLSQLPRIGQEFSRTEATVGQALTQVRNALIRTVGEIDKAQGVTNNLVGAFQDLAELIQTPSFQQGLGVIVTLFTRLAQAAGLVIQAIGGIAEAFSRLSSELERVVGIGIDDLLITDPLGRLSRLLSDTEQSYRGTVPAAREFGDAQNEAASGTRNVNEALRDELETLRISADSNLRLADALSQSEEQYERVQRQIEAEAIAREAGISQKDAEFQSILRLLRARDREADRLENLQDDLDSASDATRDAEQATRDLGLQTESTADIMRGAFEEVGRSIQSSIRDALLGAGGSLVEQAKRLAADIVAAFATQRIIIPALVRPAAAGLGLIGGGAAGSAAASGGGIGGQASNLLSLGRGAADFGGLDLGLGNIGSAVDRFGASIGLTAGAPTIATPFASTAAGSVGGVGTPLAIAPGASASAGGVTASGAGAGTTGLFGTSASLSTVLGAAGLGFAGGSLLGSLIPGLNQTTSGIGGGVGAGAGALIGSAIPGVGTVLGGLIGGAGGSLLGGLFGGEDRDFPLAIRGFTGAGGRNTRERVLDGADPSELRQLTGRLVPLQQQLLASAGAQLSDDFTIGTGSGRGATPSGLFALFGPGGRDTRGPAFNQNDVRAQIAGLDDPDQFGVDFLRESIERGLLGVRRTRVSTSRGSPVFEERFRRNFTQLTNEQARVLGAARSSGAETVEDFVGDLDFARTFLDQLDALRQGVQDFGASIEGAVVQQVDQATESIRAFKDRTEELGLGARRAEEATRVFAERLLGLRQDPRENLSGAGQELLRLRALRDNLDPLLAETGISRNRALGAIDQRIIESSRARQLQLRASLLSGQGNQAGGQLISFLNNEFLQLQDDRRRGIIGGDLFQRVVGDRIGGTISGLGLGELERLRELFRDYQDVLPGANRATQELTERIRELSQAGSAAARGISGQGQEALRAQFESIFGEAGIGRQVIAAGLRGTDVGDLLLRQRPNLQAGVGPRLAEQLGERILRLADDSDQAASALDILAANLREVQQAASEIGRGQRASLRGRFGQIFDELNVVERLIASGIRGTASGDVIERNRTQIREGLTVEQARDLGNEILFTATNAEAAASALQILNDNLKQVEEQTRDLTRVQRLRVEADTRQRILSAGGQISDFLFDQAVNDNSTLSPLQRIARARGRFTDTLAEVRGGDVGAVSDLTDQARTLLDLGRETFASTARFGEIESFVRSNLRSVGEQITSTRFIGDQISSAINEARDAQVSELKAIKDELRELREENRDLRQQLQDAA